MNYQYPTELMIFGNREAAGRAGFKIDTGRHPLAPWIRAWWPGVDPTNIRGTELSRVTMTSEAYWLADRSGNKRNLDMVIDHAKAMLRVPPAIWIDV
jgi:hypothetical protein